MEYLASLDRSLFLLINHLPHTAPSDAVALALSGVGSAGIIWFVLAAILFFKEERKDRWFFLPLFFAGSASWLIVEKILKSIVARPRPTVDIGAIILGLKLDDPSFPSGHATVAVAMAVVLSTKEPKWKWLFYALAILISLSRVYLGKHYPLDVIGGGVIGWGIGRITLLGMHVHRK